MSARERAPEGPSDLRARSWWDAVKRTGRGFREDNLTDWAAALTYYSVLSLFPALIALVGVLGLLGQHPETTDALLGIVTDIGPASAAETFRGPIETVLQNKEGAGIALLVGFVVAIWTASAYVGAYMRAANAIYGVREGRPFWKLRPLQIAVTLVMVMMLALVGMALVLTGPLAEAVAEPIGLGDAAVTAWEIAKWPVLLGVVMLALALLYYAAPDVHQPALRWITPGGVVAVVLWLAASAGFALYVANFGSYDKTYGSLGGVVVFLVWLWISNLAVLIGTEINAELERGRQLETGNPDAEEIQSPPREHAEKR